MISAAFGFVLGVLLGTYIIALGGFIASRFAGFFVMYIKFLNKSAYRKNDNRDFLWTKASFTPGLFIVCGYEVDSYSEQAAKTYYMTTLFFNIAFDLIAAGLLFYNIIVGGIPVFSLYIGIIIGIFFLITLQIIRLVSTYNDKDYNAYQNAVIVAANQLQSGASFEQVKLPQELISIDMKKDYYARCRFLEFLFDKALWQGDANGLNRYVREIDLILKKGNPKGSFVFNSLFFSSFYKILYYSSVIKPNQLNADRVYSGIKEFIEKDMDLPGRTTLACYQFYMKKRADLAAITLNQAREAQARAFEDKLPKAELMLYDRILNQLQTKMTDMLDPGEPKPLIRMVEEESF
ncbi:MAG: hypothetical protein K6E10_01355 [Eubacterium sp.]|nr:hypothetical protein [Eubacterium sp.]